MESFLAFGVPATVLIVILVEVLKRFGVVKGNWAILAAVLTGVGLAVLNRVAELVPGFAAWYSVVGAGLLAGLAASGLFDGGKAIVTATR
jgi:hypothetical protein